jgi:hypothetical protein
MNSILIISENNRLSRYTRNIIEYAPSGVVIRVKVATDYITGFELSNIILDELDDTRTYKT